MLLFTVVLYLFSKLVSGKDLFSIASLERTVELDCFRMPIVYCCTTRIRNYCHEQCFGIRCDQDFYKRAFVNATSSITNASFVKISSTTNVFTTSSMPDVEVLTDVPQTIYKNGVNDGETRNSNSTVQMKRTSRKPPFRNIPRQRYLPVPTSSNEDESLVSMASGEDYEPVVDVTAPVPESVQRDLHGKLWTLRSFKMVRQITLNWLYNHDLTDLNNDFTEELRTAEKTQCGVAPNFSPCIPIEEANFQFGGCCREKMIPTSCQHLCKYNVTEAEISAVLDASLCGILYVLPIIRCASNGNDNSECCRYKQIIVKSAPQCEMFCRSGDRIKGLGSQHLICRNVIKELIACHLSSLKN